MRTDSNNVYIIVIYAVNTVYYCKYVLLLYSCWSRISHVHWILEYKLNSFITIGIYLEIPQYWQSQ